MLMHSYFFFKLKTLWYSLLSVVLINETPDEENEVKLFALPIFYEN